MKKILLFLFVLISIFCNSQNIVNTDRSKCLQLSSLCYDENQNGKMEYDERLENFDGYVVFIYNYNDSIHNELILTIQIDPITMFNKTYEDILFYTDNNYYMATDKYNNLLFVIMPRTNDSNIIFIYDITIIKDSLVSLSR